MTFVRVVSELLHHDGAVVIRILYEIEDHKKKKEKRKVITDPYKKYFHSIFLFYIYPTYRVVCAFFFSPAYIFDGKI